MRLRLIFFAAILGTGCPHDDPIPGDEAGEQGEQGEEEGGTPDELTLADFFTQAEEAFCTWQVACNGFGGLGRCKDVMHIEQRLAMTVLAGVGPNDAVTPEYMANAVEVGRIEYDEEAAKTCLAYVAARSCEYAEFHAWTDAELAGRDACAAVFRGRMGKNGPCAEAIECAEEAICGFDPTCTDMCCVGACRVLAAPLTVGQPCGVNPNVRCEDGASCGFDPDSGMQVCLPLAGLGESCDFTGCVAEAQCEFDGMTGSYCVARLDAGDACDYEGQCKDGLVCAHDPGYNNGRCFAPADEGEACRYGPDTTCRRFDNVCDAGAQKCVTAPGNGEACDYNFDDGGCKGDLFCTQGGACSPLADEGEGCGYVDGLGYVGCSGDLNCNYDEGSGAERCEVVSAAQCPVPADPAGGG